MKGIKTLTHSVEAPSEHRSFTQQGLASTASKRPIPSLSGGENGYGLGGGVRKFTHDAYASRILKPSSGDIVFGRGGKIKNHPGNIRMRSLAETVADDYRQATTKAGKKEVCLSVLKGLHTEAPRRRFLIKNELYDEVSDERAVEKIAQAIRDAKNKTESGDNAKDSTVSDSLSSEGGEPASANDFDIVQNNFALPAPKRARPNSERTERNSDQTNLITRVRYHAFPVDGIESVTPASRVIPEDHNHSNHSNSALYPVNIDEYNPELWEDASEWLEPAGDANSFYTFQNTFQRTHAVVSGINEAKPASRSLPGDRDNQTVHTRDIDTLHPPLWEHAGAWLDTTHHDI